MPYVAFTDGEWGTECYVIRKMPQKKPKNESAPPPPLLMPRVSGSRTELRTHPQGDGLLTAVGGSGSFSSFLFSAFVGTSCTCFTIRRSISQNQLFEFYNTGIPSDVYTPNAFERWYEDEKVAREEALLLPKSLFERVRRAVPADLYPDTWTLNGGELPLVYKYLPGTNTDGVTLVVSPLALGGLTPELLDWVVPGLLSAKVEALVNGLPGGIRKSFPPNVAEKVAAAVSEVEFGKGNPPLSRSPEGARATPEVSVRFSAIVDPNFFSAPRKSQYFPPRIPMNPASNSHESH